MPEIENRLSTGFGYLSAFVTEASRAILGKLKSVQTPISQDIVRGYFEGRAHEMASNTAHDVVAVASTPYQLLLSSDSVLQKIASLDEHSVVLDFGAGSGTFLNYLKEKNFSGRYIGYDFNRITSAELSRSRDDSRTAFVSSLESIGRVDLILLCNVLVYNQTDDAIAIIDKIRCISNAESTLVVIEPYPKWYWEFQFDGLRLMPRRPNKTSELFERRGWIQTVSTDVSLFRIFGISIFPIAYCLVAVRR